MRADIFVLGIVGPLVAVAHGCTRGDQEKAQERFSPAFARQETVDLTPYRKISVPSSAGKDARQLFEALALTRHEERKTQKVLEFFDKAKAVLARYPEPLRSKKELQLKRQFVLTMKSVLPREREVVLHDYLQIATLNQRGLKPVGSEKTGLHSPSP